MAIAVAAHDLYRFYHTGDDETLALRGVSLNVAAGEMVCIVGPSGSGKSTLLSCLAGSDEPDGGYVEILGRRITRRPEQEKAALRGRCVGILQQSGNLFDHLSLEDNVLLAQSLAGRSDAAAARALLASLGLADRAAVRASRVSGGEAARAGLATALANDPRVLLADEPTGEVDAATETQLLDALLARKARGCAMIVATHSDAVSRRADRIVRLRDGRIVDG